GIHYVGQMQEGSSLRFLVDQLTEGQLEWVPLPPVFDTVVLGEPGSARTYHLNSGREDYFQGLKQQFPGEAAAIDEFKRLVKSVRRGVLLLVILKLVPRALVTLLCRSGLLPWLCPFSRLASRSLKEVVAGLTSNHELRAIFSYIFPTYGVVPSKASFSMHSILVDHFLCGAWYPKGGAGEIAFHTIPVIRKAGGNLALSHSSLSHLSLPGVSVKKGQDLVNIFAPIIISDAGIFNTYEHLLPAEARALPEIQSQLRMVTHGEGGFTIFVGLNGSNEELGLEPRNYYIYKGHDLDEIMNRYLSASREEAAKSIPLAFVSCPSAKDPTWETRHPGKSTLVVVSFARYEWFEEWKDKQVHKRGDDYEELKQAFVDTIMQAVFKLYPRIEDRIEYISSGTPLTHQHYIASPKGDPNGRRKGLGLLQLLVGAGGHGATAAPRTIPGQDLCLVGFAGALQGAVICASAVLKRNLYIDIARLKKRTEA
ncbi:Putative all-trans-retinol 13,14-reductase, partial [Nestor notabilis]